MSGSERFYCKTDTVDPYRQPVPITQQRGSQNWEKLQNGGKQCCFAFQRLFQSYVTMFSLFLLRRGHSPHTFQTPQCYQIPFHGQLLARSVASATLHCACCYSDSTSLPSFCVQIFPHAQTHTTKGQSNKTRSQVTIWQIISHTLKAESAEYAAPVEAWPVQLC